MTELGKRGEETVMAGTGADTGGQYRSRDRSPGQEEGQWTDGDIE